MTVLAFSSALAAEARLTTPTAAKPNVHLLNFILFLRLCWFLSLTSLVFMHFRRVKPVYPCTQTGAFVGPLIGERPLLDNKYFPNFIQKCLIFGQNGRESVNPRLLIGRDMN